MARSAAMTSWAVRGDRIRTILDQRLSPLRGQSLAPEDDPIAAVRPEIEQWLASASDVVRAVRGSASPMHRERFVEAVMDLEESLEATIEHRLGAEVRWVSDDQQHPGLSCAPVDVGGLLWRNVWNRPAIEGRDIDDRALVSAGRGDGLVPLGMACMSATLGVNAKQELGASIGVVEHESPFLPAYAASALHIPVLGADWWAGVDRDGRILRVRGRGIAGKNSTGDLKVTLRVATPPPGTAEEQLVAYDEALRAAGYDPRGTWAGAS